MALNVQNYTNSSLNILELVGGTYGMKCQAKLKQMSIDLPPIDFYCVCYKICAGRALTEEERTQQQQAIREIMDLSHGTIDANTAIMIALYFCILAIGIFGNLLVLVTVYKFMKDPSVTNVFICSLSCADILVVMTNIPIKIWQLWIGYWLFGRIPCYITYYLLYTTFLCSVMTLTAMSFERYLAICHPMKAQYASTVERARKVVIVIWILAFLLGLPTIFITNYYGNTWVCNLVLTGDLRYELYAIYLSVVIFFIPACIMGVTYGKMSWVLWKSITVSNGLHYNADYPKNDDVNHSRLQVIRMLVVVWVVFVVCWAPFMVAIICDSFQVDFLRLNMMAHSTMMRYLTCLAYSNSCVNPLLYNFLSSHFRKGFMDCFRVCCGRSRQRRNTFRSNPTRATSCMHTREAQTSFIGVGKAEKMKVSSDKIFPSDHNPSAPSGSSPGLDLSNDTMEAKQMF